MDAHSAFTLIELLVVVAIIAMLVSILLPALNRAKELARAAICLSNLRGTSMAMNLYAEENQRRLPPVGLYHGGGDVQGSWIRILEPYASSELLYRCKSDKSPYFEEPYNGELRYSSFGTNYYLSGQMAGFLEYNRLDRITRPMSTIYALELAEEGEFAVADHIHADLWIIDVQAYARAQVAFDRHSGKANYGFVDTHAEALALEETFSIGSGSTPLKINWITNKYDPTVAK